MKTIENKITNLMAGEHKLTYVDLIRICVNTKVDGFSTDEMRKRIRILDKLDIPSPDGNINFEDADFETLKLCIKKMRWDVIHKDIIAFEDYINNLKGE